MFEFDIKQLRALILRVVTAEGHSPEDQARLNAAYDSIVLAIAHLEQVHTPAPFQFQEAPVADLFETIAQEERWQELG
jgi:hypothetical protein